MNVVAGAVYIFSSPPCFRCLEPDPLRLEVQAIYAVLRTHRAGAPAGRDRPVLNGPGAQPGRFRTGLALGEAPQHVPMHVPHEPGEPIQQLQPAGPAGGAPASALSGNPSRSKGKSSKSQSEQPADATENPFFGNKHLPPDADKV